jgi:hypothetical protein
VRLLSGGTELDNISPSYGRFHQQFGFNHLTREEQFGSVGCEGMHSSKADLNNRPVIGEINGNSSLTVMHRLHLSLWSAGKLIPIKVCPQELELSLLTDVNDWLNAANNGSQAFEITNIQLLYDSYTVDEAVTASLFSALMRNKVMSIGTMNAYQVCYPLGAGASQTFSTVRAFSRLAQIWITFRSTRPRTSQFICPGPLPGDADREVLPMSNTIVPQCRVSIGPHNWPDG